MSRTPYSEDNQAFTNKAHMKAREDVYPLAFHRPVDNLHYLDLPDAQYRDYNMGIDRTIGVDTDGLRAPLNFSVQERFRQPEFAPKRDITITEFNNNSGLVSELYKIEASFMVYGYFDVVANRFIEVIMFRVPAFMEYLAGGKIKMELGTNSRSNQTFCCFKFDDMLKLPGLVKFHKVW